MKYLLIIFSFLCLQSHAQVIRANPYHTANSVSGGSYEYLLDEYPGAVAAFSYWKLSSSYTGACVRVTNLNTAAEQDFGFVGNYIDTAGIKTFVGATNAEVVFYDQSGSGNHTSKQAFADAPRIIIAGVPVREASGLWSFSFGNDGNIWYLKMPTGFLNGATSLSYFQTVNIDDPASSNGGVFGPSTTNNVGLEVLQLSVASRRTFFRFNGTNRNDNAGAAYQLWDNDVLSLTSIFGNSTSTSAFKNGSAVTLTSSAGMPSLNFNGVYAIGLYNSSIQDASGRMSELVIYTTDQTANRAGIEANINSRHTIY